MRYPFALVLEPMAHQRPQSEKLEIIRILGI